MMSERLQDFIRCWCNVDTSPEETAAMLKGESGTYYRSWLEAELLAAAQAGLDPSELGFHTNRWFANQNDVDEWLAEVWPLWFGKTYPASS
jgi:hypothetical protein